MVRALGSGRSIIESVSRSLRSAEPTQLGYTNNPTGTKYRAGHPEAHCQLFSKRIGRRSPAWDETIWAQAVATVPVNTTDIKNISNLMRAVLLICGRY
jgi:hypothetical protein